jgi:DNA-directed RNA polymerase subunit H (RpoH/RPB5)
LSSDSILDRKVQILLKLRGYKLLSEEETKEGKVFTVEGRRKKKLIVWAITNVETIGIRYINQLAKRIETQTLDGGVIISNGRFTYSSKANSRKKGVELIPSNFPSFNIFDHFLVPTHEILSSEEKEAVLKKYRVHPYQLPLLRTSDPISKVIGARPGDLVKVTRESQTAGEHVSYRYVVEG